MLAYASPWIEVTMAKYDKVLGDRIGICHAYYYSDLHAQCYLKCAATFQYNSTQQFVLEVKIVFIITTT